MKTLKNINRNEQSLDCLSLTPGRVQCKEDIPYFNPDYFAHVVVQTLKELESIPCKLRQDGMVASIVQDEYSEWQLQSSKTGFGVCDNRAWVKIVKGDSQYDGGNLFLFDTEADANNYIDTTLDAKQGQMFYIAELDNYYKFDGQDGLIDILNGKAEDNMVVHIEGEETIVGDKTFSKPITSPTYPTDDFHLTNKVYVDSKIENIGTDYVLKSRRINTENGLEGGGELDRDLYIGIDSVTRTNIDKGVEGYEISTKIGDPDSLIPDWSNDIITKTNF